MSADNLVESVAEAAIAGKTSDLQPNSWFNGEGNDSMASFSSMYSTGDPYYVTSCPLDTDVSLPQDQPLTLRLNSSFVCESIAQHDFPGMSWKRLLQRLLP